MLIVLFSLSSRTQRWLRQATVYSPFLHPNWGRFSQIWPALSRRRRTQIMRITRSWRELWRLDFPGPREKSRATGRGREGNPSTRGEITISCASIYMYRDFRPTRSEFSILGDLLFFLKIDVEIHYMLFLRTNLTHYNQLMCYAVICSCG